MSEKVRITVEFERPGSHTLEDCAMLVMNQMKAMPKWGNSAGTGLLNYVCHDGTLRIVAATIEQEGK